MQSSRREARATGGSRLRAACGSLANDLERWLILEVEDFEHLPPMQSLVLDAWALLTLAAERDDLENQPAAGTAALPDEFDSQTAGAAPIRDMGAVSVVVEARGGFTPQSRVAPATGWSSPSSPPARGWAAPDVGEASAGDPS